MYAGYTNAANPFMTKRSERMSDLLNGSMAEIAGLGNIGWASLTKSGVSASPNHCYNAPRHSSCTTRGRHRQKAQDTKRQEECPGQNEVRTEAGGFSVEG